MSRRPMRAWPSGRWCGCLAALVLALAGCVAVPTEYREPPPLAPAQRETFNLRVFDRAWELVNENYFDVHFRGFDWAAARLKYRPEAARAPTVDALYQVINAMCAGMKESHLVALAPRRVHELDTDHRVAVGIRWQLVEGKRVITDVVPGSPAAAAGILRGWLVETRNGAPVHDNEPFIGHIGQPITLGLRDQSGAARQFALQPKFVSFDRNEVRELPDGYIYLRFDRFTGEPLHWLSQQLKRHENAPGVILDVRQNGGGNTLVLDVAVAEFFRQRVDEGELIQRNGRTHEARSVGWLSARYAGQVALLTSAFTGSAAEIFCHVLQHDGRAIVVGRRTAGAVIYARTYSLPDGGSIQVPVIDYVGLDGKRLEGRGVTPDVPVPAPAFADLRADRDRDLEAALQALRSRRSPGAAAPAEHR